MMVRSAGVGGPNSRGAGAFVLTIDSDMDGSG